MRRLVIAFALGAGAFGAFSFAAAFALTLVAAANGWGSFALEAGPIVLLEFERTRSATSATFGPGLAVVAVLGGSLNACGAAVLARRV